MTKMNYEKLNRERRAGQQRKTKTEELADLLTKIKDMQFKPVIYYKGEHYKVRESIAKEYWARCKIYGKQNVVYQLCTQCNRANFIGAVCKKCMRKAVGKHRAAARLRSTQSDTKTMAKQSGNYSTTSAITGGKVS